MSVIPLRKPLNDVLREASEHMDKLGAERVVIIVEAGDDITTFTHGFETENEVKHLLHDCYEDYLIGQIDFEVG